MAGIGHAVDLFTAAQLGTDKILTAAGLGVMLLALGLLEKRLRLHGSRATAFAAILAFTLAAGVAGAGLRGVLHATAGRAPEPSACSDDNENAAPGTYALPAPNHTESGDLSFCPVDLNDGHAVKGRYTLSGSAVGTVPKGKEVALVMQPDPSTCDTNGNPGTGDYFLMRRLKFTNGRSFWQIDGRLPYPESSSIRRIFHYVIAPPAAVDALQRHNDDNSNDPDYPGMPDPPRNLDKVSTFAFTPSGSPRRC
ncbi:hypothetical protein AB0H28_07615 [Micromonospora sp. NPDC050980]|uniref:hypothetical protein n=1 Tax=Micromonospora sp. NPDC050980 TaxID=3155161 RepID=UPI0033C1C008